MNTLKRILIQLSIGANIMAAFMLWACGLSSGLNPAVHSHAALFGLGFPLLLLLNIALFFFGLVFPFRYVWLPFVGMLLSVSYIYDYCPVNWLRSARKTRLNCLLIIQSSLPGGEKNAEGRYPILDYLVASEATLSVFRKE